MSILLQSGSGCWPTLCRLNVRPEAATCAAQCRKVSTYGSKYAPWRLVTYVAFSDERKAETFERYLKSGSGHAFARKDCGRVLKTAS